MGADAHSPTSVAPTRVRYAVLGTACSLAVLTYVQRQGFVAATPYVKEDLRFGDELMGYLGAAWPARRGRRSGQRWRNGPPAPASRRPTTRRKRRSPLDVRQGHHLIGALAPIIPSRGAMGS